jgi:hypothetical protein
MYLYGKQREKQKTGKVENGKEGAGKSLPGLNRPYRHQHPP